MATLMPTPDSIIIWLDQYIGEVEQYHQLKKGVGEQANPEKLLPDSPFQRNLNDLIQFKTNMEQSFDQIPHNLKAFSDENECLQCIGESLKNKLKVFFITSGTKGKLIAPKIMDNYPSLKTIYVFCGNCEAHLDWTYDCLDRDVDCIVQEHHLDLLTRLLRDVAEYFIGEGDNLLSRSEQLAYSAIFYFTWAKLLLERANRFAQKKLFDRLAYVDQRIAYVEELIKRLKSETYPQKSKEAYQ